MAKRSHVISSNNCDSKIKRDRASGPFFFVSLLLSGAVHHLTSIPGRGLSVEMPMLAASTALLVERKTYQVPVEGR